MDEESWRDVLDLVFNSEEGFRDKLWDMLYTPWMRRERMATAALQGILAKTGIELDPEVAGRNAFIYAQALMEQLEFEEDELRRKEKEKSHAPAQ